MAGGDTDVSSKYSTPVAAVFIFNLVVGVGCLTLPHAFQEAGMILGAAFLSLAGFLAFVTATWVVEVLAAANAILNSKVVPTPKMAEDEEDKESLLGEGRINIQGSEGVALVLDGHVGSPKDEIQSQLFSLDKRVEIGMMADIFLGNLGQKAFYLILCVYLFGDLSIYAVYVPRSIVSVTGSITLGSWYISEDNVYYICLALFALCTGPFCFFDFQKTKYLQFATMFTRNAAFTAMIIIACIAIAQDGSADVSSLVPPHFDKFPDLFGATIYAFMCHHSIPGLLAPIENKRNITFLFLGDFLAIITAYLLLAYSALFAYADDKIPSTYTTFFDGKKVIAIILALYPVFTLTTNFPLISITLRNNLIRFFPTSEKNWLRKWARPIGTVLAFIPPVGIAFATRDVGLLVSITGSYPGLGIMFLIPATLVLFARRRVAAEFGDVVNPFRSPFHQMFWVVLLLLATVAALGFTVYSQVESLL